MHKAGSTSEWAKRYLRKANNWLAAVVVLVPLLPAFKGPRRATIPRCDAPSYFAICDPFVPGLIISNGNGGSIWVRSTWSKGPAENAGICPGDQIVAIDGISVSQTSAQQHLRQLVSSSPKPMELTIKRGSRERLFHVVPVRESTLARLSNQRYVRVGRFGHSRLIIVPYGETREEAEALENFELEVEGGPGFKQVDGYWVPIAEPSPEVDRFRDTVKERGSGPLVIVGEGKGYPNLDADKYSLGLTALILSTTRGPWIYRIFPNSPAYRAGLFTGDEIVKIGGKPTVRLSAAELSKLLFLHEAREVTVEVKRGGSVLNKRLMARSYAEFARITTEIPSESTDRAPNHLILGIHIIRSHMPAKAVVVKVDYPSPAFASGVLPGDEVVSVNGSPVARYDNRALARILLPFSKENVSIKVLRMGKRISLKLTPTSYAAAEGSIGRRLSNLGPVPLGCTVSSF